MDYDRANDFVTGYLKDTETKRRALARSFLEPIIAMGAWNVYRKFRAEEKSRGRR